jgi:hypothetical protein
MAPALFVESDRTHFAKLEEFTRAYEAKGRTESAALLIWFLETIFRLDDVDAQDSVCDRKHDAGVDAVSVRDDRQEVFLFQAKRKQKLPGTLGDTDLKEFVGSLRQFSSEDSVKRLISTSANEELKRLLQVNSVAEKIGKGYATRPVFVCNIAANRDATNYLRHARSNDCNIDLWDLGRLGPVLNQLSREWFVEQKATLTIVPQKVLSRSRWRRCGSTCGPVTGRSKRTC